jgi:hypothetical protein
LGRPCLHLAAEVGSAASDHARQLLDFLATHAARRLNVAGPRASQEPKIAAFVHEVLEAARAMD